MRIVLTQHKTRAEDRSNIEQLGRLLRRNGFTGQANDAIVLPELIGDNLTTSEYLSEVSAMARQFGCHVVGGSHMASVDGARMNQGVVVNPGGEIIARYGKANPYNTERNVSDGPGGGGTSFRIGNVECFAMICADFFHVGSFQSFTTRPEIIFVPSFSVTRKSAPDMARARWRHAMVARAYEQAAYIAVSDWAYPVHGLGHPSSGVAALAHPDPSRPVDLLRPLGRRQVEVFNIDLAAGRLLREDQRSRGFEISQACR